MASNRSGARAHTSGSSHKRHIEPPANTWGIQTLCWPVASLPVPPCGGCRCQKASRHRALAALANRGAVSNGSIGCAHTRGSSQERDIDPTAITRRARPSPVSSCSARGTHRWVSWRGHAPPSKMAHTRGIAMQLVRQSCEVPSERPRAPWNDALPGRSQCRRLLFGAMTMTCKATSDACEFVISGHIM